MLRCLCSENFATQAQRNFKTHVLMRMVRACFGLLVGATWVALVLYTQAGPISVIAGFSRDIAFPPLVEGREHVRSSTELDAEASDALKAEIVVEDRGVVSLAGRSSLPGSQPEESGKVPEPVSEKAQPQDQIPSQASVLAGGLQTSSDTSGRKQHKSQLAYARFPKTGSRYVLSRLRKVTQFSVIPEKKAVRAVGVAAHEFLLGSVRNPCTSYLSLWAFQSEASRRAGVMVNLRKHDPEAYQRLAGRNSANGFTSLEDVNRFRNWIKFMGHADVQLGLLSGRFHGKYLSRDRDMDILDNAFLVRGLSKEAAAETAKALQTASMSELADCWLHTESLDADLTRCPGLRVSQGPSSC